MKIKKVVVRHGITHSIDYQSFSFEVGLEAEVEEGEDPKEVRKQLQQDARKATLAAIRLEREKNEFFRLGLKLYQRDVMRKLRSRERREEGVKDKNEQSKTNESPGADSGGDECAY